MPQRGRRTFIEAIDLFLISSLNAEAGVTSAAPTAYSTVKRSSQNNHAPGDGVLAATATDQTPQDLWFGSLANANAQISLTVVHDDVSIFQECDAKWAH